MTRINCPPHFRKLHPLPHPWPSRPSAPLNSPTLDNHSYAPRTKPNSMKRATATGKQSCYSSATKISRCIYCLLSYHRIGESIIQAGESPTLRPQWRPKSSMSSTAAWEFHFIDWTRWCGNFSFPRPLLSRWTLKRERLPWSSPYPLQLPKGASRLALISIKTL